MSQAKTNAKSPRSNSKTGFSWWLCSSVARYSSIELLQRFWFFYCLGVDYSADTSDWETPSESEVKEKEPKLRRGGGKGIPPVLSSITHPFQAEDEDKPSKKKNTKKEKKAVAMEEPIMARPNDRYTAVAEITVAPCTHFCHCDPSVSGDKKELLLVTDSLERHLFSLVTGLLMAAPTRARTVLVVFQSRNTLARFRPWARSICDLVDVQDPPIAPSLQEPFQPPSAKRPLVKLTTLADTLTSYIEHVSGGKLQVALRCIIFGFRKINC
jgi:hypothetical protein